MGIEKKKKRAQGLSPQQKHLKYLLASRCLHLVSGKP